VFHGYWNHVRSSSVRGEVIAVRGDAENAGESP
jgi:hypothetical protein